jgi:virulence-associated protein VagC
MGNVTKARVFMSGRSQHVTIPVEFRFRSSEVTIRRDANGDVVLSEVPSLAEVFAALDAAKLPKDFMGEGDRDRRPAEERPALNQLFDETAPEDRE